MSWRSAGALAREQDLLKTTWMVSKRNQGPSTALGMTELELWVRLVGKSARATLASLLWHCNCLSAVVAS